MSKFYRDAQFTKEVEGRQFRLAKIADSRDIVVFDARHNASNDPAVALGLGAKNSGASTEGSRTMGFRVTEKDKRPATRVPFHEPDPDRFVKSEEIKARLAREAERLREYVAANEGSTARFERPERPARPKVTRPANGALIDISSPRGRYVEPPADRVCVVLRRGGQVLKFVSAQAAETCLVGKPRGGSNVRSCLGGTTNTVFGWTAERVAETKRGRFKAQP